MTPGKTQAAVERLVGDFRDNVALRVFLALREDRRSRGCGDHNSVIPPLAQRSGLQARHKRIQKRNLRHQMDPRAPASGQGLVHNGGILVVPFFRL
jgi:hypothetical protein